MLEDVWRGGKTVKIGFTPKSKDDWRLLLTLARYIRLASKVELSYVVQRWKTQQSEDDTLTIIQFPVETSP